MIRVPLSADLVEAFSGMYLSPKYDNIAPTPDFHREMWRLYSLSDQLVSIAAPREHAKSTAGTHDFGLATVCFRDQDYVIIVSATEDLAIGHLGDMAKELRDNEELRRDFKIRGLSSDAKTEIVVDFLDGHQCKLVAKGSGQKMRGMKWNGKRPGLILCDDLEEDDQVENADRRQKFRRWFLRALIPCLRRGGKIRFHGTILHEDSMLARTMKQKSWTSRLFAAHKGFDDFSNILWPEQFPEERLRGIRQKYIDDGDSGGYSQEYLNNPLDNAKAYIRKADFLGMTEEDHDREKIFYVGSDFAVSKKDSANRTAFVVGGVDVNNTTHIVDVCVDRWETDVWIAEMFLIQQRWKPAIFFVEDGVIWKSVAPMVYKEMRKCDVWMNIVPIYPVKDKAVRGRPFQKRMRAGGVLYDEEAEWFPPYQEEVLKFTGNSDAVLDDQYDATATLFLGLESSADVEDEDLLGEEELTFNREAKQSLRDLGRSSVTGY